MTNKKVLLHERKRRTDRGLSSTPSAVLSRGGGGGRFLGGAGGLGTLAGEVGTLGYPPLAPGG